MSFKEGLRRHGKATEAALMAEFSQLEELNVYEAVNARFLTRAQRRSALRAINLIKEKRCGSEDQRPHSCRRQVPEVFVRQV